jgi:hypothetical protein
MAAICINALEGRHMSAYAAGNFTDAEGTIYAKDLDKSGRLFKRKNGVPPSPFLCRMGVLCLKNGVVIRA